MLAESQSSGPGHPSPTSRRGLQIPGRTLDHPVSFLETLGKEWKAASVTGIKPSMARPVVGQRREALQLRLQLDPLCWRQEQMDAVYKKLQSKGTPTAGRFGD